MGTLGLDSVETPFASRDAVPGGSATHFSLAAGFFTDVRVVGVVGDDLGEEPLAALAERGIDVSDVERVPGGRSFRWRVRYDYALSVAGAEAEAGVLDGFRPRLSEASRRASTLYLGNFEPALQREVREACPGAALVGLDTMDHWIETARDRLVPAIAAVDCVVLNEAEIRRLAQEPSLPLAARTIRAWGPRLVVVKLGRHGAALFTRDGAFAVPGYPLERIVDPTGAGDHFAGGFLGYLDAHADEGLDGEVVRRAMVYGSVVASFGVEGWGPERIRRLTRTEIGERFDAFQRLTRFEAEPARDPAG
ncbi:MAG: PfkB family carbohydrate kinase [Thermoleophilia bacterium]